MDLLIDTNVILDVCLEREPFYEDSKKVLTLCRSGIFPGYLSSSSVTDLFYIIKKATDLTTAYTALEYIIDLLGIISPTRRDILEAYLIHANDFEDCLLAVTGKNSSCDAIITRNKKDFLEFDIATYTPQEFLSTIKN